MLVLQIGLGLVPLVAGGEALVRGAVRLAARLGASPLLIGFTIVGFGTSTPERVTSLQAAFAGSPGIAAGNVVGSNIANILLILGVAALLSPVLVARDSFRRDGLALALTTLAALAIILGVTALAKPIAVPPQIANFDVWVMLGATGALIAMVSNGWRIGRAEGAALLLAYIVYIGWLALRAQVP